MFSPCRGQHHGLNHCSQHLRRGPGWRPAPRGHWRCAAATCARSLATAIFLVDRDPCGSAKIAAVDQKSKIAISQHRRSAARRQGPGERRMRRRWCRCPWPACVYPPARSSAAARRKASPALSSSTVPYSPTARSNLLAIWSLLICNMPRKFPIDLYVCFFHQGWLTLTVG